MCRLTILLIEKRPWSVANEGEIGVQWSPQMGLLKFNVDRVPIGKPRLASTGEVLHNSKREILFMFYRHVGVTN